MLDQGVSPVQIHRVAQSRCLKCILSLRPMDRHSGAIRIGWALWDVPAAILTCPTHPKPWYLDISEESFSICSRWQNREDSVAYVVFAEEVDGDSNLRSRTVETLEQAFVRIAER